MRGLADAHAQYVGEALRIARPGAVADRLRPHHRRGVEMAIQRAQQSGSRRRDQFCLHMRGIDRQVLEQLRGCRGRHREPSVGAVHKATPDVDRGTVPLIEIQGIHGGRTAGDIHDGIDAAHLVKMNLFRWNAMDAAFRLRQQGEGSQAEVTGALGQVGPQEKARESAARLRPCCVLSVRMRMAVRLVVVMIVLVVVLVLLDRPGNGRALMQPAVDHDIDLGRLNPAPAHPGHA